MHTLRIDNPTFKAHLVQAIAEKFEHIAPFVSENGLEWRYFDDLATLVIMQAEVQSAGFYCWVDFGIITQNLPRW